MGRVARILKFALFGAVGFGLGELVLYQLHWSAFFVDITPDWLDAAAEIVGGLLARLSFGAIGGLALGLALGKLKKRLIIYGSIGFFLGGIFDFDLNFLYLFSTYTLSGNIYWTNYQSYYLAPSVTALSGAIGGGFIGFAFRNFRTALLLASIGFVAFLFADILELYFLDAIIQMSDSEIDNTNTNLILRIANVVWLEGWFGGALLGATLGYIEKENKDIAKD